MPARRPGNGRAEGEVGGWIFNIQRYSLHDGPGTRTIVFFQGCPLRCLWCDNPESQEQVPKLLYIRSLCQGCHRCVAVCPNQANSVDSEGKIHIDRSLCKGCGQCVEVCAGKCRSVAGRYVTVGEVMEVVKKDTLFYRNSGGGVTLSGGEPTYQPDFALELLKECTESGFHTCLETCGYAKWPVLKKILAYVDLVLFDIKQVDPDRHQYLTGVSNALIVDNLKLIAAAMIPVMIRVPFLPACNGSRENMEKLGQLAVTAGVRRIELIPFHQLGRNKYEALDMDYTLAEATPVLKEDLQLARKILESYDLEVTTV